MWYLIGAIVVGIVAFLAWRITSVERGARQRDRKLIEALNPFGEKLSNGSHVTVDEVSSLCAKYELRPMLYHMLKHFEKLELVPEEYTSWESQAEGLLAEWMMHPNELQAPPETMECLKRVQKDIDGQNATFIVLKYKMPTGHWAGDEHWILGLSGPFVETEVPYSGLASAFSRCNDQEGEVEPEELVDWFVDMCRRKSG